MLCGIYAAGTLAHYKYVIIFARQNGKWIMCKHKGRDTLETPGGHVEPGETPLQAARRELYEETGSIDFEIEPICDYCAADKVHGSQEDTVANGAIYYARVFKMGELPESEMEATVLLDDFPHNNLTYPDIIRELFPIAESKKLEYEEQTIASNDA